MTNVRFSVAIDSERGGLVDIAVDGTPLQELIAEVEKPFADAEGRPSMAGQYDGILTYHFDEPIRQHFLGSPQSHLFCGPHDRTVLLSCTCGEPGCWPLMARVRVSQATVEWSDFEQPHRRGKWFYEGLRFTFDRAQYESALAEIEE